MKPFSTGRQRGEAATSALRRTAAMLLRPTWSGCADALKDYDTSRGTIRLQADNPLPPTLVRKLVKARMAENEAMDERVGG